jgi:hypothetical protein
MLFYFLFDAAILGETILYANGNKHAALFIIPILVSGIYLWGYISGLKGLSLKEAYHE